MGWDSEGGGASHARSKKSDGGLRQSPQWMNRPTRRERMKRPTFSISLITAAMGVSGGTVKGVGRGSARTVAPHHQGGPAWPSSAA